MGDLYQKKIIKQIIELLNNTTYQTENTERKKEFINNKTELLINITIFLSDEDLEKNIELINSTEIPTEQPSQQKIEFLIYIRKLIIAYIKSIMEKNKKNEQLRKECIRILEAIDLFLDTEKYISNIEVLKKQKAKILTLKKYDDTI